MNFLRNNKKYISIALLTLFVIFSTILFLEIINNGAILFLNIKRVMKSFFNLISPFIVGFFIAFILNSPSKNIIKLFDRFNIFKKKRRLVALLITYLAFFGSIFILIKLILPTIILNIYGLGNDIYDFILSVQTSMQKAINASNSDMIFIEVIDFINQYTNNMIDVNSIVSSVIRPILNWIYNIPELFSSLVTSFFNVISIIFDSILAIMISFYFLMDKNIFINFFKKTTKALFSEKRSDRILYVSSVTNSIFQKFLIGKSLDSLLIGILFFIIVSFFDMPYALLFSVIIGITNMIPYFGPFIGAIPVIGLLLIIDLKLAFIASIIILCLQQFDGIYLGPKILGETTGVRPIGIVFAVTVGGRLFGAIGMLLGVPVFATFSFFFNEFIDNKHKDKILRLEKKDDINSDDEAQKWL